MKLSECLRGIPYETDLPEDLEISAIAYDSRRVVPGGLFVAIEGFKSDGHDYIPQARARGAAACVVTKKTPDPLPRVRVDDGRRALAVIAGNFYGAPTSRLKLLGVTGTNGKTSITHIARDLLTRMGQQSGLIGTIHNLVGDLEETARVTTPESLELEELFSRMVASGIGYCVMEVSSHALSLSRVDQLDFNVGVFTNLTQDHLDYHQDMEDYYKAKKKLFTLVDTLVVNLDSDYGQRLLKEMDKKALTYGIRHPGDLTAEDIAYTPEGTELTLRYRNQTYRVMTPYLGEIYVSNLLGALGGLLGLGFDMSELAGAVGGLKPVKGRLERVVNPLGAMILVDYAHTPDALENVLKIGRSLTRRRLICVFGCGGDRDKGKRPRMGRISQNLAEISIITSDNPRKEDPMAIIEDILDGMAREAGDFQVEADRRLAIARALSLAEAGDTVIIAGKGHETYQILGETTLHFSDVEVVQESLERMKRL